MLKQNFLYFQLCSLPFVLSLSTTERTVAYSARLLYFVPSGIYTL